MRKWYVIWPIIIIVVAIFFPYNVVAKAIDHTQFIAIMAKEARLSNHDIMRQRDHLLTLYHQFLTKKKLTSQQTQSLSRLAKQYKLGKTNFKQQASWQQLLLRVDVIPISLVVAQSINESAWGTSRFAREGHNYFGQWCYSKGCGIVPRQRAKGAIFEVQRFTSRLASIRSYMMNLNTLHLYNGFRTRRHLVRLSGRPVTGLKLVDALSMYSIRRQAYVRSISGLITRFHLASLDQQQVTTPSKSKKDPLSWL